MEKRFKLVYLIGMTCILLGFFTFFYGTVILPGLDIHLPFMPRIPLGIGIAIGFTLAIIGLVCIRYVIKNANLSDEERKKLGI
ncbi:MAG: hypothetical protein NDI94_03135 [Candidatus Woesearchaeota archaeon]|nr:hypothetical protein [Candidatus Woesearchaeota archaeon]